MNTFKLASIRTKSKLFLPLLVVLISLVVVGIAYAFTVGSVEGIWSAIDTNGATRDCWASGPGDNPTNTWNDWNTQNPPTGDENQVRYGDVGGFGSCSNFDEKSGFGFDGNNGPVSPSAAQPFYLGKFTHYNNPIQSSNSFEWVDLAITVPVTCPDLSVTSFSFSPRFYLHETSNDGSCEYPGSSNCPDRVIVDEATVTETFSCGSTEYSVNILGFQSGANCSTTYNPNAISETYYTEENSDNVACLWAEIISSKVEVIKDLTAATPGVFDLWIQKGADPAVKFATDVGDGGTTGQQPYDLAGTTTFTVSETAGTGTNLANYWKTIACYDREDASLIAATPAHLSLSSMSFSVDPGQDVYCIITNKDIPTAATIVGPLAVAGDGKVTIRWSASMEDTFGYFIYRNGVQITDLIPPQGPDTEYSVEDKDVVAGTTYSYWIQTAEGEKVMLESVSVDSYLKLPVVIRK